MRHRHASLGDTQTCGTYVLLQAQQTYAGMVYAIDMWTLHKNDKNYRYI